jgi:hypothetical protein
MTAPPVGSDIDQALYIHRYLAAQVAFYLQVLSIDGVLNAGDFIIL